MSTTVLSILVGLGVVIWYFLEWISFVQLILVVVATCFATGHYRWFYVALRTAPRDLKGVYLYIRLLLEMRSFRRNYSMISEIFRENVKKHPHKTCIVFEDQEWDFAQVEDYSNRVANVFKSHGYKKGDVIALFLENKPEYVAIWLGLSKLGVVVSLVNSNLTLTSLVHSVKIAKSQAIIFGRELSDAVIDVLDQIDTKIGLYQINCNDNEVNQHHRFQNLDHLLKQITGTPPALPKGMTYNDKLLYIYTSGTTGLPKAAIINGSRFLYVAVGISWMAGLKSSDRVYIPLPLYHTAGGCMGVGQMLIYGSTLVLRKKFSSTAYFADCAKYKCTVAQYIGEMCRYILAVPPKPCDTQHNVKVFFGNGLKPQIWAEFVKRFNIPQVTEFYGTTEGNANTINIDNTVGAIGFLSRIVTSIYPIAMIKVDQKTDEPIRNAEGMCILCQPDEPGVFVAKISANNPSKAFLGYVDKEASKKKIVRNVFKQGDEAFLSGDLLVADELGYLYFVDRTGDTFRWKGENVSTSEVEAVLSNLLSYKDVVVYGVEIEGQEGRACMAAIVDSGNSINFIDLTESIRKFLPSYARPIFLRILPKVELTGTFKLKKNDLQNEGFNPSKISDTIYYLDSTGTYTVLTTEAYEKINCGLIRV